MQDRAKGRESSIQVAGRAGRAPLGPDEEGGRLNGISNQTS